MTNREIALEYLECFCSGNIDGIEALLSNELSFKGTIHTYDSASDYLDSLRSDPPEKSGLKILSVTEDKNSVAVFYEYQKEHKQVVPIAQLFRIRNKEIHDVLLIFDGRIQSE